MDSEIHTLIPDFLSGNWEGSYTSVALDWDGDWFFRPKKVSLVRVLNRKNRVGGFGARG
jgi:hypothetical protein